MEVLGEMAGPPCESWCVARWLEGGGRPLRDADRPWGLPEVAGREVMQLRIGNMLLLGHKEARFLTQFLDTYKNYRPDIWYYNGGEKPVTEVENMI